MPKIPSIGDSIPKIKAKVPDMMKFVLMAIGWIIGRILHVEIDKVISQGGGVNIISFPALLDSSRQYTLTTANIAMFAAAAFVGWMLFKFGRFLKWLGVGVMLYIVTFETYELLYGEVLTPVQPLGMGGSPATEGGAGF